MRPTLDHRPGPASPRPTSGRTYGIAWCWTAAGVVAVFLAGCRVTGPAEPPPPSSLRAEEWAELGHTGRMIETEHFLIYSTLADAELESVLPEFVEAAYARYVDMLPPPRPALGKLKTYVFATRAEWAHYTQVRYPGRSDVYQKIRQGGFTEGDTAVLFYTSRSGTLATIAHEGWHQYVGTHFATTLPAWLNEGLACYFESFHIDPDRNISFSTHSNRFRINSLREGLYERKLFSVREMVDVDAGQVINRSNARITQIYYAQAWALVSFFLEGGKPGYASAFRQMMKDITNGTLHTRLNAARLTTDDPAGTSYGASLIYAYFKARPEELAVPYYEHMQDLSGY